jgi:hypothetical protein
LYFLNVAPGPKCCFRFRPAIAKIFATYRSVVSLPRKENNMLNRYITVISEKAPTTITTNECFTVWQKVLPKSSNLAKEIKSPIGGFGIICYLLAELFLKMAELFGATGRKPML